MHYKNSMVKIKQNKVRDFPRVIIPKPKSLNKICETPSAPSSLEIYGFGTGLGEKTIWSSFKEPSVCGKSDTSFSIKSYRFMLPELKNESFSLIGGNSEIDSVENWNNSSLQEEYKKDLIIAIEHWKKNLLENVKNSRINSLNELVKIAESIEFDCPLPENLISQFTEELLQDIIHSDKLEWAIENKNGTYTILSDQEINDMITNKQNLNWVSIHYVQENSTIDSKVAWPYFDESLKCLINQKELKSSVRRISDDSIKVTSHKYDQESCLKFLIEKGFLIFHEKSDLLKISESWVSIFDSIRQKWWSDQPVDPC